MDAGETPLVVLAWTEGRDDETEVVVAAPVPAEGGAVDVGGVVDVGDAVEVQETAFQNRG